VVYVGLKGFLTEGGIWGCLQGVLESVLDQNKWFIQPQHK
jgi:hypothetical protein